MQTNPFLRRNMRFGFLVGLITGILLALALYARSEHPIVLVFIPFAALMGWYTPYLMYKINEED
ncbi:hypothetical protein TALC_00922 [Thermoplasmatales archaeon BRNA1]|nr:hypothetical protein TALC_00922 [Thermoplasmatales archaeon BRNA1]